MVGGESDDSLSSSSNSEFSSLFSESTTDSSLKLFFDRWGLRLLFGGDDSFFCLALFLFLSARFSSSSSLSSSSTFSVYSTAFFDRLDLVGVLSPELGTLTFLLTLLGLG